RRAPQSPRPLVTPRGTRGAPRFPQSPRPLVMPRRSRDAPRRAGHLAGGARRRQRCPARRSRARAAPLRPDASLLASPARLRLPRAAAPATLFSLILSAVIGAPLDVIASGPTAPDPTTFAEALTVLERRGVGYLVPAAVRARLEAGARGEVEETPKAGDRAFER